MPAKELSGIVVNDLGKYGLNSQASPSAIPHQWLTVANNIILDEQGRVSTRKAFQQISENLSAGENIGSVIEYVADDGSKEIVCGSDDDLYVLDTTKSPDIFVAGDRTQGGTYSAQTITSGRWQWANFNRKLYGVQEGHTPVIYDGTNWIDMEEHPDYDAPSGVSTFDPSCILGEYGRLWVGGVTQNSSAESINNVVFFSDTLIGESWTLGGTDVTATYGTKSLCEAEGYLWDTVEKKCYSGLTGAGVIDLSTVWGGDRVVAIHAFMGLLVIFGTQNIAIYRNPEDPFNMVLDEVIEGIGLKARDSIAHIGNDIIFLTNSGIKSLSRIVAADGKMPLKDLSRNIRDELQLHIVNGDMSQCVAEYCLCGGFYMLSFPDRNTVYYCDFTLMNDDGTPRISKFLFNSGEAPTCLESDINGNLWVGRANHLAHFKGYYDQFFTDVTDLYNVTSTYNNQTDCEDAGNTWDSGICYATHTQETCEAAGNVWEATNSKCWRTDNKSYNASFKTVWMDFERPHLAKLLKKFYIVIAGGQYMDVSFNYFRDYGTIGNTQNFSLYTSTVPAYYGSSSSLYGSAKFATTASPTEYKFPLGSSAKEVQFEMKGDVKGYKASLQNITALAKLGKIR